MSKGNFNTEPQKRYLEDYVEGDVHQFGPITITEDEIIQFSHKFDPQLFQTDPEKVGETVLLGAEAENLHVFDVKSGEALT